ncbi:MAG TPA: DUF885 domain-containing protein [Acidimicrobiales bacterium]|nr:DUF885 domain-containing protein [Acidimicrobiales bacterium]
MSDTATDPVQTLVQAWLEEEMAEAPTRATALGVPGYDDELGQFDDRDFERRAASARAWAERFMAADVSTVGPGSIVDRELVLSALRGRIVMQDWEAHRCDPAVYLDPCLSGVFNLFLHRLRPAAELARSAASRLRQVPVVMDAAMAQIDPARLSPVLRDRALGQCRAAAVYARDLLPAEVAEEDGRAQVAEAGGVAAEAFSRFAAHLEGLEPAGEFAIGEARYSALLREREMLGYGAGELHDKGRRAWSDLDRRMGEVARRMGHDSWRGALDTVNDRHPATPDEMLDGYRQATARCREFLARTGLVTLPDGEECLVVPSPAFQRPVLAVASYAAPAAFSGARTGHFFVPYPPEGTSPEALAQRLATNSFASMATISAHEAYPGHHWHLVWSQMHAPRVRSVVRTPYFSEGWGLFAEHVMGEAGFFADDAEWLSHLDARIFRAARIVVDTALHTGEMTFDQAVDHMHSHTGLSRETARAEVVRYCAWPTQAPSYLTGALELERLRDRWVDEKRGDRVSFNDAVAATGSLPLGLAEKALFETA